MIEVSPCDREYPIPMPAFSEMGLSEPLMRAIGELGFEEPTPIQEQCIGLLLAGRDVVAQAQTGTGKTAAFGLPMLERIQPNGHRPQALVLAPTRELAIQDAEALHSYGKYRGIHVAPVYGGQSIDRQFRVLGRGVDVVVGTPGRLIDHLRRGTLVLDEIRMVVLDEADEMLNMGFVEDIELILGQLPTEHQTALFSATMPARIRSLAQKYLHQAEHVTVSQDRLTVPQVRQFYYEVLGRDRFDVLTLVLDATMPASAIIFARTRRDTAELAEQLMGLGYLAEAIHGDLSQTERDRVMRRFREGLIELLVATDVAARGLDIPEVTHVINYDVPVDPEAYVHRIGRTGRAGREGEAITLATSRERNALRTIERLTRSRIYPARLPTQADVAVRRREALKEAVRTTLLGRGLDPYLTVVEDLSADFDLAEIAAAALKMGGSLEGKREGRSEPPARSALPSVPLEAFAEERLPADDGMTRLSLNLGRMQRIRPADVVGAIANEAGIPGRSLGAIDIYDTFTLVEVPSAAAAGIAATLRRTNLRGHRMTVEVVEGGQPQGRPRPPRR